jgi:aspartate-semialdehyde dehydrogenase
MANDSSNHHGPQAGKIRVGVLGATGAVGQRFVSLLAEHPWFDLRVLAASSRSAGRRYVDACRWYLDEPMPARVREMTLQYGEPGIDCEILFSALPNSIAGPLEETLAAAGYAVYSNAGSHRQDPDVPLLIPEVNPEHTALIGHQRQHRGWPGFIVTNPNCTATHLTCALKPLHDAFGLRRVFVVSMQAVSGAGYPGVSALDITDNVIPYISNEEDKVQSEPCKMLGTFRGDHIEEINLRISAHCNRVQTRDAHLECVSVELGRPASAAEVQTAWEQFEGLPQRLALPSAPAHFIEVRAEPDRPQPRRDRHAGQGMTTSVGRLRACELLDYKFALLGHNTIRGAAGGSVLNAELMVAQGYFGARAVAAATQAALSANQLALWPSA